MLAITVVMTWPLAPRAASAGRLDSNDGQFAVWNVAWVARTLIVNPGGLYDANIFHPHRGTLAFSDPNIGAGVLAIPAYWLSGGNPYLAHNSVVLLGYLLSLAGMYGLVRHLTGHRIAGLVSGVAFAFCAYTFSHSAHIQLLMTAGLPLSLLAMHRFVERQTPGRTLAFGLIVAAQALSCGYYGIFTALAVTPGIVFYGFTRGLWRRWTYWAAASAAGLLALAIVMPFFLPFLDLKESQAFGRSLGEVKRWSARWASYLASPAWAHRWIARRLPPWGEVLYPGTVATVMALAGAWFAARATGTDRAAGTGRTRDHAIYYVGLGGFMAWASFGPNAGLYNLFFDYVPVFTWISSPSRMGLMVTLALAVLAGFGVARVLERVRRPALVGAVFVVITMADVFVAPLFMVDAAPVAPAYEALRQRPEGPVAEFPFFGRRLEFMRHAGYMVNATAHWRPLVNGYSDFIPPEFREMAPILSPFPHPESFAILRQLGVRYVVFHMDLYSEADRALTETRLAAFRDYLSPIVVDGTPRLYEIVAWPSR